MMAMARTAISLTEPVFHSEMSSPKVLFLNISLILVTLLVSQAEMSPVKVLNLNIPRILVTALVFHLEMSPVNENPAGLLPGSNKYDISVIRLVSQSDMGP